MGKSQRERRAAERAAAREAGASVADGVDVREAGPVRAPPVRAILPVGQLAVAAPPSRPACAAQPPRPARAPRVPWVPPATPVAPSPGPPAAAAPPSRPACAAQPPGPACAPRVPWVPPAAPAASPPVRAVPAPWRAARPPAPREDRSRERTPREAGKAGVAGPPRRPKAQAPDLAAPEALRQADARDNEDGHARDPSSQQWGVLLETSEHVHGKTDKTIFKALVRWAPKASVSAATLKAALADLDYKFKRTEVTCTERGRKMLQNFLDGCPGRVPVVTSGREVRWREPRYADEEGYNVHILFSVRPARPGSYEVKK